MGRADDARREHDARTPEHSHPLSPRLRPSTAPVSFSAFIFRCRRREPHFSRETIWKDYRAPAVLCAFILSMAGGSGSALATAVCSNTPTSTQWIFCEKTETDTGDLEIDVSGLAHTISTTGGTDHGIYGNQSGAHALTISVEGVSGTDTIKTTGQGAHAIRGHQSNAGDATINVGDDATLTTEGSNATGIHLWHSNNGDAEVNVTNSSIETKGGGYGINVNTTSSGMGSIDIDLESTDITSKSRGINAWNSTKKLTGYIDIDITNGTTTTDGNQAFGIFAWHKNNGQGLDITGDITIDLENHTVLTKSDSFSYGIYAYHENDGNIVINFDEPENASSVTTQGANSHGIVAYHTGDAATRSMTITVGGTVTTEGAGAQGVRMGTITNNAPARVAALDANGYRRQTVTVNNEISSQGAGVFLANGGRVIIGSSGSISSDSGIAILATGTVPEVPEDSSDPQNVIPKVPAIPPKLRVDLNLDGRQVAEALGDDWILNDGGETTIAMNGVVLHDGARGVTGSTARNGAWNVRMVAGGVKVTDRTDADPAMWVVSNRAGGVVADRDFAASDFSETVWTPPPPPRPRPTPPPTCPAGQIGTPPNCMTPPPPVDAAEVGELVEGVVTTALDSVANALDSIILVPSVEQQASASPFVEEYAPRAAVYEALPDALLGVNHAGQGAGALPPQGSFAFAHTLEESGGLSPAGSTVGQSHGFGYSGVQFGWTMELSETLSTSAALHRVRGTISVDAGTGGGEIGFEASGVVLDAAWQGRDGFYARAGLSTTHYEIGAKSQDRAVGMLTGEVEARGSLVRVETGREIALSGGLDVAPRLWLKRSALSVDDFTDAVGSRVSFVDTVRITSGVGMTARTERPAGVGTLALEGSVDLAHLLGGAVTVSDVSGTRLASKAEDTDLRLALAGVYRQGGLSLAAEASMNGSHLDAATGAIGMRLSLQF